MSWTAWLPDLSARWHAYKDDTKVKAYVEEGWTTRVDLETGLTPAVDPHRHRRKPRRDTDPNPMTAKMYKKKIRARAVDYHRGALNEMLEFSSGEGSSTSDERTIKYKTTPRWNRKMLEEQRNKFWEDALHRKAFGGDARVWSTLKRFMEDQVRAPQSHRSLEVAYSDTEGPVIDTGVIDGNLGLEAHAGNWRRDKETGGMMYYYHFKDGSDEAYKVPAYVITAPSNRLG